MPPRSHRILHRILANGALAFITLASVTAALISPAMARQEYYDALSTGTGTCADCRLCHTGPVGNGMSFDVTKPFLRSMLSNGRLGTIPDAAQDSDMDGATDLVELQEFGDPNDPLIGPGQFECPSGALPEYGCAITAPAPSNTIGTLTLGAFAASLLLRRRRVAG
jgi:uncharacterized protein (TIGR03382 family)